MHGVFYESIKDLFSSHFIQKLKRIITMSATIMVFMICVKGLNYLYVREDEWSRKMFYDYYKEQQNIDNLYVGSSHVHWDINPKQLDELNGMNNFNMSISDERLDTAYYLIKEVNDQHKLSQVYLEMYYYLNCVYPGKGDLEDFQNKRNGWRATDYMKWSFNKLEYMGEIWGNKKGVDTWLPFVRYRERLFDTDYINEIMERKQNTDYKRCVYYYVYEDGSGSIEYQDKGYVCGTRKLTESEMRFGKSLVFNPGVGIAESSEIYLRKIIEYCKKHKINITLITSPIFNLQLLSTENYDEYINQVFSIAEEYGIAYYDFNLIKPEYLDIQSKEYFANTDHLTSAGGELYTYYLWEISNRTPEENEIYFCKSYQEKLSLENPKLYGYYYWGSEGKMCCKIASNREEGMEYRIWITPEGTEEYLLQDFSTNKTFQLPIDGHGMITIEARMGDVPSEIQTLEVAY